MSRVLRMTRTVGIGLLGFLVVWIAVGIIAFVYPANDDLDGVDAVFVLGPATNARIEEAERIVAERGGDIPLIVSKPNNSPCYVSPRICVAAKPATTVGEAAALRAQAEELGFHHPAIVTFTPHVARTRFIFDKCYGDSVAVVGVRSPLSFGDLAYQFAYQTAAFAKALISGC